MFIHGLHSTTKAELNLPIPPLNNDTSTAAKFQTIKIFVKQSINFDGRN